MSILLKYRGVCISEKFWFSVVVIIFLSFLSSKVYAQNSTRADRFFEAQQYHVAASLYEQLLAEDTTHFHAAFHLAHCYRELFRYELAEKYYAYVAESAPQNFPASLFYFAQSLKRNEQYEQALQWYERFLSLPENQLNRELKILAKREKEGCLQAILGAESPSVMLRRLPEPVNSTFQEFAPVIYQHDSLLLFSSSRVQSGGPRSNRSGESFTDLYLMQADANGWQDVTSLERMKRLNTDGSEASGSFTADGKFYFFTRCNEKGGNCQVFVSQKTGRHWQTPQALPSVINLPGSNTKHPGVSASGDTLFFVSDREGGHGGSDIWMSTKSASGGWNKAENLGPEINTVQDEVFPFYSSHENLLIFASDGREGKGGMDLYLVDFGPLQLGQILPLEGGFNSSRDDCCFTSGNSRGYLSSNRDGNFDIYSFTRGKGQSIRQLALGITATPDASPSVYKQHYKEVISDFSALFDDEPAYLSVMHSGSQDHLNSGSSRFVLSADVNDILLEQLRDEQALAGDDSSTQKFRVTDTLSSQNVLAVFSTNQISEEEEVEIRGRILLTENNEAVSAMRLYLLDQEGNILKITTTNAEGDFRFINLEAASAYQIMDADAGEEQNYVLEYEIYGYGDEIQTVKFENIYFDFNQSALRNEARVALNELVEYYQQHPTAVIEINAFTDTTGNDVYNLQLSRDRGLAAFDYLLEAGVDRASLVINARGASTAVSSSNTFVSQQLNRRVEFYVTGRDLSYESDIVTRMLRPQITLYTLSSSTGMSIDEIKALNGISGNELQAYKPVRLYGWAAERAPALFYQMTVRSEE